ncbi:MAG: tetratricopeptide repeat protein [Nitrospirae bacterium]|nr:tetratricopeptide repeat protein [Nitrospirota bacterium]
MIKRTVIFLLIFTIYSTDAFALLHYFKNAKKAEESGNFEKALSLYNKVLERYPYETKSKLRAYDHILNIYKTRKESQNIKELLTFLKNNYPDKSFDLRDIEKLSQIYSKYGENEEALKLQWRIIDEPYSLVYADTMLRTYSRLLKYYKEKKDENQIKGLLNKLNSLSAKVFDDEDIYKYAMLFFKYGDRGEAIKIMEDIVQRYPDTTSSRKSLFILAEEAQKAKDYEDAIEYYSIYIERYPENTFYVQKAYQRLVDCYLAMGDSRVSEDIMKQVADWLNGVTDYRSQLNLAIDLKSKNMDKLAEVTFNTGYTQAKKVIEDNPETYDALKAYLEIMRTAHPLGRYDIAEQVAIEALKDFNNLQGDTELNKNVNFIKSQAYLWLSKIYKEHERYDETIKMLENFLKLYPEHKDKDYALYELGRAYEKKGDIGQAKDIYEAVSSEPLKSMAKERLATLK